MAAFIVIMIMSVMSIAGMNTTTLSIMEALLLASVIYAGSGQKLRVPEILINAPYVIYQRLFWAVGLISLTALVTWGLLGTATGVGIKSLFKRLFSSDDATAEAWAAALPFLGIPAALVFSFVIDFLVAFAGAVYLTNLLCSDETPSLTAKPEFDPQPESMAAKAN
jgi:hypothetical protein